MPLEDELGNVLLDKLFLLSTDNLFPADCFLYLSFHELVHWLLVCVHLKYSINKGYDEHIEHRANSTQEYN